MLLIALSRTAAGLRERACIGRRRRCAYAALEALLAERTPTAVNAGPCFIDSRCPDAVDVGGDGIGDEGDVFGLGRPDEFFAGGEVALDRPELLAYQQNSRSQSLGRAATSRRVASRSYRLVLCMRRT